MIAMPTDRRRPSRLRRSLVAAALAVIAGCGGSDGGVSPVGAAGYSAVIDGFAPPVGADGSRPVVYVARLGEDPFALDDQVAMITAAEDDYDLRFVDDIAAAVDTEESDAPPRDDGLLVGIGTISTPAPHVVRVEIYRAAGLVDAHKVTLTVRDDVWRVESTEPVDPEVLVGEE
jgi:hypothetical protein